MERHQTDFEQNSDGEQCDADEKKFARAVGIENLAQAQASRVAVQHRDAEQEERGREGAHQEVLERRFLAQQSASPGEPAE